MEANKKKSIKEKLKSIFSRNKDAYFSAEVANELEKTQIDKFHWGGGTGFAAEEANALNDKFNLKEVEITGTSNELNGPDRIVNGQAIQTKYFDNPYSTLNAAFDNETGNYRYGNQLLEVPSDQYEACVESMKKKIANGKVPGYINPEDAEALVMKGSVSYKQARNIARAGNIDSLLYDVKTQSVTTSYVLAISFAVEFAMRRWEGQQTNKALKDSIESALGSGAKSLITGIVTSQILRTKVAAIGTIAVRNGVRTVATTTFGKNAIHNLAAGSLGKAVYGAAAVNHVSKLLRTNFITSAITTVVVTAPDLYRASVMKNISWTQFSKNLMINVSGVAGGTGGWIAGTALGTAIFPGVGTVIGGIVGAFAAGTAFAGGAKVGLDRLIKDDAHQILAIVQEVTGELANDYLLSEKEVSKLGEKLKETISNKWLRKVYSRGDEELQKKNIYDKLDPICLEIASGRPKIFLPPEAKIQDEIEIITNNLIDQKETTEVSSQI